MMRMARALVAFTLMNAIPVSASSYVISCPPGRAEGFAVGVQRFADGVGKPDLSENGVTYRSIVITLFDTKVGSEVHFAADEKILVGSVVFDATYSPDNPYVIIRLSTSDFRVLTIDLVDFYVIDTDVKMLFGVTQQSFLQRCVRIGK